MSKNFSMWKLEVIDASTSFKSVAISTDYTAGTAFMDELMPWATIIQSKIRLSDDDVRKHKINPYLAQQVRFLC